MLTGKKMAIFFRILVGDPTVHEGGWDRTDGDSAPEIVIYDDDGVEVRSVVSMSSVSTGVYVYEWDTGVNGEGLYRWLIECTITDTATLTLNDHGHMLIVTAESLNQMIKVKHEMGMPEEELFLSDYSVFQTIQRSTSHITGIKNTGASTSDVNDAIFSWAAYECYARYCINKQGAGMKNNEIQTAKLYELRGVRDRSIAKIMQGDEIQDTRNLIYQSPYT